ncbi:hypothetical protein HAX54_045740, partial [Datura stramonium]|nr:hypothetical protein [Datura stramonium]
SLRICPESNVSLSRGPGLVRGVAIAVSRGRGKESGGPGWLSCMEFKRPVMGGERRGRSAYRNYGGSQGSGDWLARVLFTGEDARCGFAVCLVVFRLRASDVHAVIPPANESERGEAR